MQRVCYIDNENTNITCLFHFSVATPKKQRGEYVDTEMKKSILVTQMMAQYDEQAKRLLGHKSILAHILVRTVEEFKGMNPKKVEGYIEGEPMISHMYVEPGLTNTAKSPNNTTTERTTELVAKSSETPIAKTIMGTSGERITGLNSEQTEVGEGNILFDVVFYVWMRDGLTRMIINVEAQKEQPTKYSIVNRAVYYESRLISSQKNRDFENSNYDDIKRVYSIWLCMNMDECIWDYIHLTDEKLLGTYEWKGNLDLFNVVLIGLPKELPEKREEYWLHRLLTALFSEKLTVQEKLEIIRNEYNIVTEYEEKEVNDMCNLGEGIWERGIAQGITQTKTKMILNMDKLGIPLEEIATAAEISVAEVQEIISRESVAV